jgi:DNA-binding transcriptional MocR family regulator
LSDDKKERLVKTLAAREIPLIEDDIWGDIPFAPPRPKAAKAWDKDGNVLLCSSFSKSIAPGYRVGWVAPGRWRSQVTYLKTVTTLASPTLPSLAVAEFLENGGYDAHLRRLRKAFASQVQWTIEAIDQFFPEGTRVTRPSGGQVVWVELPESIDALELFREAIKQNISIAPGPIFSAQDRYRNFIRLNCGYHASANIEVALRTLGQIIKNPL